MALVLRPPTSRESLTDNLAHLGRTRKSVALATGLFLLVGLCTGVVVLAGLLDAAFHLPPLLRALALVATLVLGGIVWLRNVSPALALKTDALAVALELEEKYPALNDALASAVSFLDDPEADRRGVSNRLQAAAVRSARRLAERHEFGRMIPSGACWRAAWACILIVAASAPLILVDANRAAIALVRFADPFGAHPWPTKTRIELLSPAEFPARIPNGEPFDLKFAIDGVVTDRAAVVFRLGGGDEFEEHYPLASGGDPARPTAAVVGARIDAQRLPGSFSFRIVANDADTGWLDVVVVPPPRLVPLDGRATPQFRVIPPEYTGLSSADLPGGTTELMLPTGPIPAGTTVTIRGATDVRLSAAALMLLADRSAVDRAAPLAALGHLNPVAAWACVSLAESIGAEIPLVLDSSGRVFSATFTPSFPGAYSLRLTDETGWTGTRTIDIPWTRDPVPLVVLARPAAGRDPLVLTPNASIQVHVISEDRELNGAIALYGLRRTFLEYRVGTEGAVRMIPLRDARAVERVLPAVGSGLMATARARPSASESLALLPVAALTRADGTTVRDGDTIYLRGAADDWDDLSPAKPPGRSEGEVEIHIVSADGIDAWLQRELAALRPELLRLRDHEREVRNRTLDVSPKPDGSLSSADRDRLLSAEHIQDQIDRRIGDPRRDGDSRDGVLARAQMLRETLRANGLPRSNTTERVERVADELMRLAGRELPAIKPSLLLARDTGARSPVSGQERMVPDLLSRAERHQKAVEDGLTGLLDLLDIWGGAGEIRGEARILRDLLNRLAGDTDRLGERVPTGRSPQALAADQRSELDRMASRVEQVAEQTGALIARAGRLAQQKETSAAALQGLAAATDILAGAIGAAADKIPPGEPSKSALNARAGALRSEAEEGRVAAGRAVEEVAALRKGIAAAGGQALPDEVRQGARAIRDNRQADGSNHERSAASRLDRLADALAEKQPDAAPDLKKWRKAADELNNLADSQDDLRKRAAEASRLEDPARRTAEIKGLAAEQDRLIERGKDLLQRLTRDRADAAARDTRAAIERMEAARSELERGDPAARAQRDAVDRLDSARDRLDAAAAQPPERLADEKRRKLADKVKGLLDRQKAAVAEAGRIHKLVAEHKEWRRPVESSYVELARTEISLAEEVAALEAELASLPVLARVVSESMAAMKRAASAVENRLLEIDPALPFDADLETANDRKVLRPMALAARRLEQLLDALKPEDAAANAKMPGGPKQPPKSAGAPPTSPGGGDQDVVSPLAQLKVLRALQEELNLNTAEFARAHPDPDKLTDEERDELKELERAQREIAALFEQMAKLFDEHKLTKSEPAPEGKP
jgi:hypothetical protein